jgi:hypothetical protein
MTERKCATYGQLKSAIQEQARSITVTDPAMARQLLLIMNADMAAVLASIPLITWSAMHLSTVALIPHEIATNAGVSAIIRFGSAGVTMVLVAAKVGWPVAHALLYVGIALGGAGLLTALIKKYKVGSWSWNHVVLVRR